jgi:hypothetical protein
MTTWTSKATLKGPLFTKNVPKVVMKAIYESALESIGKELIKKDETRKKKGGTWPSGNPKMMGAKANVMELKGNIPKLEVVVSTTTAKGRSLLARLFSRGKARRSRNPRTKGTTWARKNMAAVRGMARGKLDAAAKRIVSELG